MYLFINSGPVTQTPLTYVLSITSNESYDDLTEDGKFTKVIAGQEMFKRYISTNMSSFMTIINAKDVNLEGSVSYTVSISVSMDSGLTAEASKVFEVSWEDTEDIELDVAYSFNRDDAIMYLTPSCTDSYGIYNENVLISVYRKEFDGGFTELAKNLTNTPGNTITDPHPTLDYARYRLSAKDVVTGKVYFSDIPSIPTKIPSIIIQWDESWSGYTTDYVDDFAEPVWKGSAVKLPYNVDESDSNNVDVQYVEYIGRKHPVSYFGTHVGQTASWSTEIPKSDVATIYALRRLAAWPGNAYVRSPSGVGYWATVTVSFSITHLEMTVPVTLDIKRVEGGA